MSNKEKFTYPDYETRIHRDGRVCIPTVNVTERRATCLLVAITDNPVLRVRAS